MRKSTLVVVIVVVLLATGTTFTYICVITDPGRLESHFGFPNAINNHGQITERLTTGGQYQTVVWQKRVSDIVFDKDATQNLVNSILWDFQSTGGSL